jgi:hypothetical protein
VDAQTRSHLVTLLLAGAVLAASLALVLRASRSPARRIVASWTLTPGVVDPRVTQATIRRTICVGGWTREIRPPAAYTSTLKLEQLRAFGLGGGPGAYQEDHLISLELGGHPTDPRNLWPQPHPRAEQVDAIENELNRSVCRGTLSLAEARRRESFLKHTQG